MTTTEETKHIWSEERLSGEVARSAGRVPAKLDEVAAAWARRAAELRSDAASHACCEELDLARASEVRACLSALDTLGLSEASRLAELDLPPPATRARAEVLDFAARREDVVRLPYARAHSRSPRACVFAAAVPLPDLPGRVRGGDELGLWTVRVGRVDAVRYAASRDQLWAEAASRIRSGERWLPTEEEERLLHPEPEPPAPDLGAEVRAWWVGGRREGLVTVERVAAALRPRAELTRALRVELGHAMRRAGFRAQVIKLDGKRVTVYEAGSRP